MRIKLSRWQKLFVVLSVIYLIITIFIAWNKWSMPLPDPRNVIPDEPRDLLQGQRPTKGDIFDQISPRQPIDLLEANLQYKKSLRIERLKIIGIAFKAWVLPSALVYLLGFSISRSKRVFKNIRVGIILIFVGIFIPTVFYPLVEPLKWVKYTPERNIQIAKGKEIHYKLYELGLPLGRIAIPYNIFVASGIVLVFIGTGICVLNKDKKTTTTKNDNSIVTGNNSN